MGKTGDGGHIATRLSVWPGALSIFIANAILNRSHLLHNLMGIVGSFCINIYIYTVIMTMINGS
jgi:hypothetical protein